MSSSPHAGDVVEFAGHEVELLASRATVLARELEPFGEVFIATPPEGHDPGSLTPAQNAEVIRNAHPYRSDLLSSDLAH